MSVSRLLASEIRNRFLGFFTSHDHSVIPSSRLVPSDPSLLFTAAGMVQFKDVFSGLSLPPLVSGKGRVNKVATVQRCVRAGGKHNDLDIVGHTARHHTYFEMMGNFSFRDYGKEEAIKMAWEFIINKEHGLGIHREKLAVSVLEGDTEAENLWKKIAGLDDAKIFKLGKDDNYWSIGEVGPCGPCTEIFFDQGKIVDGSRWLELWNLVFMQYETNKEGITTPLPSLSVDTGMGLERVCAVLQNQPTNFDTDVFQPLVDHALSLFKVNNSVSNLGISSQSISDSSKTAIRIIVDHMRAACGLIGDGVIPSGAGRGYVLRRIIRRAVRYAATLQSGAPLPLLNLLVPTAVFSLQSSFPNIDSRMEVIRAVLEAEEIAFLNTLKRGEKLLLNSLSSQKLDANTVFELYDRYGFPLDLIKLICKEKGALVDENGFLDLLQKQKAKSRQSWSGSGDIIIPDIVKSWKLHSIMPKSISLDQPQQQHAECNWETSARILAAHEDKNIVWISIDPCPFYAKGGGQVGDCGFLLANGFSFKILDCVKPYEGGIVLMTECCSSENEAGDALSILKVGTEVKAVVDMKHRLACSIHHSATHMLQYALRKVLGNHVTQAGSLVNDEKLRFDFTHTKALSPEELTKIEKLVCTAVVNKARAPVPAPLFHRAPELLSVLIML